MTPKERRTQALLRRRPPGEDRELLESMLPPREPAVKRFREYAQRAEKELAASELNRLSERMAIRLDESPGIHAVCDEVEAEQAERQRSKGRLKVVKR
jgi:hypothetical protein